MTAETTHGIPPALTRFASGETGWREACKELGLWSYDDLYTMLQEHGLTLHMPARDNAARDVIASLGLESE